MTIRDYLDVIRERWLIIALSVLVVMTGAVAATLVAGTEHTARLTIVDIPPPQRLPIVELPNLKASSSELLLSETIAARTAEALGDGMTVEDVLEALEVFSSLEEPTVLAATDDDPDRARAIADTHAAAYVEWTAEVRRESIRQAIEIVDSQIAEIEKVVESSEGNELELLLNSQVLAQRADTKGQLESALELESGSATVVGVARLDQRDYSEVLSYGLLGATIGLILGFALAFAVDSLDETVRSRRVLLAATGTDSIATVPFPDSSSGPAAEPFRVLAATLTAHATPETGRTLLVTSATSEEDMGGVGRALALAFATSGQTAVYVQADRHIAPENRTGLADVLAETTTLDEVVRTDADVAALSLVGPGTDAHGVLLGSAALAPTLATLADRFDWMILAAPAVLDTADALYLAPFADRTLFVVREGGPEAAGQIRDALTSIRRVSDAPVDIVMTVAQTAKGGNDRS